MLGPRRFADLETKWHQFDKLGTLGRYTVVCPAALEIY